MSLSCTCWSKIGFSFTGIQALITIKHIWNKGKLGVLITGCIFCFTGRKGPQHSISSNQPEKSCWEPTKWVTCLGFASIWAKVASRFPLECIACPLERITCLSNITSTARHVVGLVGTVSLMGLAFGPVSHLWTKWDILWAEFWSQHITLSWFKELNSLMLLCKLFQSCATL